MCCHADIARCELLIETVDEFVPDSATHYVVVDRRDLTRFSHLERGRRKVLCVEDMLAWWIVRVPGAHRWWLSLKSPPLRNWFLQQIVKLSIARYVDDDVLIFADSDVAFFRPFDPASWVVDGQLRLFRIPGANATTQMEWHRTAGTLLGLGRQDYFGASYIGNLVSWRRENVLQLLEHIAGQSDRGWMETITSHWHLSEYILYGVYVDKVLGQPASGHFYDSRKPCCNYWGEEPLSDAGIREFLDGVVDDHVAIMISSKAGIKPDRYKSLLRSLR